MTPILVGCAGDPFDLGGPADIAGDGKADGGPGIDVQARIEPGMVDATLSIADPRLGYVFYAAEDTKVTLEVTHGGTQMGLDTNLKLYGPRLQNGQYIKTLAQDEDNGYGKLSKIQEFHAPYSGFYLVELTFGNGQAPFDGAKARLQLTCDGTCTTTDPIVPIDEGLKWYRRSAERRALSYQAYEMAQEKLAEKVAGGVPTNWAVVLDIDETTLNNSAYQQSRLDLGVGYSPGSWTAWVNQKAATAIDGVGPFIEAVHQSGGKVVFVTNRMDGTECPQTADNLATLGITYDAMLCKTTSNDKNPRFAAIAAGTAVAGLPALNVIMYVGDNITDFPMLTQDIRKQDASAFSHFGDDYIVIPNSMYGSFDANPN